MNEALNTAAANIRRIIFKTIFNADRGGHIASCFSIVEILTSLYCGGILLFNKKDIKDENRDRFILSKGHGVVALYATLCEVGLLDPMLLQNFGKKNSKLGILATRNIEYGVEASTGSLGHGFGLAGGIAFASKNKSFKIVVLLGDGECQEGTIWECALFAAQNNLDNLIAIIDHNKLQAVGYLDDIVSVNPLIQKWKSFGWETIEINGHNFDEIIDSMIWAQAIKGKPKVIVANTIKGKGISYMENSPLWHNKKISESELKIALDELGLIEKDLLNA
jgi:transketolase